MKTPFRSILPLLFLIQASPSFARNTSEISSVSEEGIDLSLPQADEALRSYSDEYFKVRLHQLKPADFDEAFLKAVEARKALAQQRADEYLSNKDGDFQDIRFYGLNLNSQVYKPNEENFYVVNGKGGLQLRIFYRYSKKEAREVSFSFTTLKRGHSEVTESGCNFGTSSIERDHSLGMKLGNRKVMARVWVRAEESRTRETISELPVMPVISLKTDGFEIPKIKALKIETPENRERKQLLVQKRTEIIETLTTNYDKLTEMSSKLIFKVPNEDRIGFAIDISDSINMNGCAPYRSCREYAFRHLMTTLDLLQPNQYFNIILIADTGNNYILADHLLKAGDANAINETKSFLERAISGDYGFKTVPNVEFASAARESESIASAYQFFEGPQSVNRIYSFTDGNWSTEMSYALHDQIDETTPLTIRALTDQVNKEVLTYLTRGPSDELLPAKTDNVTNEISALLENRKQLLKTKAAINEELRGL